MAKLTRAQEFEVAKARGNPNDLKNLAEARRTGLLKDESTPAVDTSSGGNLKESLTQDSPKTLDNLDDLRKASKFAAGLAFKEGGGANRGLDLAAQAGVELFNPATIQAGIKAGTTNQSDIKDIFKMTLDSINQQGEARKNGITYLTKLMEDVPEFYKSGTITGSEFEYINKFGYPPESLVMKLATYKQEHPEAEKNIVANWAAKYADAGINLNDSLDSARIKLLKSKTWIAENTPKGTSNGDGKPLDILNIQRYKELYPNAGIEVGDTKETANAKVQALNAPEDMTNDEILSNINEAKSKKITKEQMISEINSNDKIKNKDVVIQAINDSFTKKKSSSSKVTATMNDIGSQLNWDPITKFLFNKK